ncbi:hypothetical protein P5V15_003358 [Pogonomyrmex californicus]
MATDMIKSIPSFYAGQSIFLTGATGFLGKVFIEKVLRSCPDVREIFLLMRPKKGQNINERLQKILNLPLYENLRGEQSSNFKKLIPILGDASEKGLGLSDTDRQMLIERVTIIIHAAASVRFNNSLKYAICVNTRSTRDVCILAQSMKNLIALVYVSTAYAHVNNPVIEEKVYPSVIDWQKMIEMAESLDEHTLNILTAKCLDYIPNTYIFSKILAESVVQTYSSSLPCAILRPSMVFPTLREPIPGWIDNIYGPIGLMIGTGKGFIRVVYTNKHVAGNFVPVDSVVKAMLVVTWKLGLSTYNYQYTFMADSMPFVFNCTRNKQKCRSAQYNRDIFRSIEDEIPLEGIIWDSKPILTNNFILYFTLMILLHILPAMLIDLIFNVSGRRPRIVQLQRNIYVISCTMRYFLSNEWEFNNTNCLALLSSIPVDDQDRFSFELSNFYIRDYYKNCMIGAKKFLLHEDINRVDRAKAHRKRTLVKLAPP